MEPQATQDHGMTPAQITFEELLAEVSSLPENIRAQAYERMRNAAILVRKSNDLAERAAAQRDPRKSGVILTEAAMNMQTAAMGLGKFSLSWGQDFRGTKDDHIDGVGHHLAAASNAFWIKVRSKVNAIFEAANRLFEAARDRFAAAARAATVLVDGAVDRQKSAQQEWAAYRGHVSQIVKSATQEVGFHAGAAIDIASGPIDAAASAARGIARDYRARVESRRFEAAVLHPIAARVAESLESKRRSSLAEEGGQRADDPAVAESSRAAARPAGVSLRSLLDSHVARVAERVAAEQSTKRVEPTISDADMPFGMGV